LQLRLSVLFPPDQRLIQISRIPGSEFAVPY
jgi:hypothetical protein